MLHLLRPGLKTWALVPACAALVLTAALLAGGPALRARAAPGGSASGLAAPGDQLWHQDVTDVDGAAETEDTFGHSLAAGDFNGDGELDLAVGVPYEDVSALDDAGAVNVLYGSGGGLTAVGDQLWHQDVADVEGGAEVGDHFGFALAAGDFNGDGRDDLAIGVPNERIGALASAGAVNVLYGSAGGLTAAGDQLWHQDVAEVEGGAETGDIFGSELAAGDFNGDGRDDLAIGVPLEDVGALGEAGAVNVLYGSGGGLTAAGDQLWHQDVAEVEGAVAVDDRFGSALATGDFNGDGRDDLAIGVPVETIGAVARAGAVNVLYGSGGGLTAAGDQLWHQDVADVDAEADDRFGSALAAGDFNGDGRDDLAIGVPGEDVGALGEAGAVNVLYGSAAGLAAPGDQLWHQDVTDVEGAAETQDYFGWSVAAGDFNGDGRDDLAIGVPGENIGALAQAGAVNVLHGSGSGLTAAGDQLWHQDVADVDGAAGEGENFGSALAAGDFNGDGRDDLAIGVPGDGAVAASGAVNVLYGEPPPATPTPTNTPTNTPPAEATPTNTPPAEATPTNTPPAEATPTNTPPAATPTDTPLAATNTPTSPAASPTPTRTPTPLAGLPGDADCNGIVNAIDAALILQLTAGLIGSVGCPENADVNDDGSVNAIDAALVLQFVAGLIGSLPP